MIMILLICGNHRYHEHGSANLWESQTDTMIMIVLIFGIINRYHDDDSVNLLESLTDIMILLIYGNYKQIS